MSFNSFAGKKFLIKLGRLLSGTESLLNLCLQTVSQSLMSGHGTTLKIYL